MFKSPTSFARSVPEEMVDTEILTCTCPLAGAGSSFSTSSATHGFVNKIVFVCIRIIPLSFLRYI